MKKFILAIVLLFAFFGVLYKLSDIVIEIKIGHRPESTFGKTGISNSPLDNSSKNKNDVSQQASTDLKTQLILQPQVKSNGISDLASIKNKFNSKKLTKFVDSTFNKVENELVNTCQSKIANNPAQPQNLSFGDFIQVESSDFEFQHTLKQDFFMRIFQPSCNKIAIKVHYKITDQLNFNYSIIEQSGNCNIAIQRQTGVYNIAWIKQLGSSNIALQAQNGVCNSAKTYQNGILNFSIQDQRSILNSEVTNQSGIFNTAIQSQDIELPGDLNSASSNQSGICNTSVQKQNGSLNHMTSLQSGVGNIAVQSQSGSLNDASIYQNSIVSIANQNQISGSNGLNTVNRAEINQTGGSCNYAEQAQNAIGEYIIFNSAETLQKGSSNFAKQTQAGAPNYSTISQTGSSNFAIISQIKL